MTSSCERGGKHPLCDNRRRGDSQTLVMVFGCWQKFCHFYLFFWQSSPTSLQGRKGVAGPSPAGRSLDELIVLTQRELHFRPPQPASAATPVLLAFITEKLING